MRFVFNKKYQAKDIADLPNKNIQEKPNEYVHMPNKNSSYVESKSMS